MGDRSTSFRIDEMLEKRISPLLIGSETISQFARRAVEEKIKRMEARDDAARVQLYQRDMAILEPMVREIFKKIKEENN